MNVASSPRLTTYHDGFLRQLSFKMLASQAPSPTTFSLDDRLIKSQSTSNGYLKISTISPLAFATWIRSGTLSSGKINNDFLKMPEPDTDIQLE